MVSILIITLVAFVAFLFLTGYGIMPDFSRLWLRQGREGFSGHHGANYYSELAVTIVVTLVIAVSIALLKGAATILVVMATTDDIASFTTALRGTFSSYTTELQDPRNYYLLLFLNPILRISAVYFLMYGIRSFFNHINKRAGGDCYGEVDALYFSSLGVLFLIGTELLCHSQDVQMANMAGNIAYLLLDKFSYIVYYLTLEEIVLLRSNKKLLKAAIDKYLITNRTEKNMVQSSWKMIAIAYALGLLLSLPCFLGFQWIRDNTALMSTFIIVLGIALFVMKKAFSDSWNLLGTVLLSLSSTFPMQLTGLHSSNSKSRRPVLIGLLISTGALLVFGIAYPKQLLMLVLIIVFAIVFVVLAIVTVYYLTLGIGSLVACITKNDNTNSSIENSFTYMNWTLSSLPQSIVPTMATFILAFMAMTCFPKELPPMDDLYVNSSVVDPHGEVLYVDENHEHYYIPMNYDELPEFFKKALVNQEDRYFFHQNDLWPNTSNWHGISLSFFRGRGGSNISAQVCKNITFIKSEGFPKDIARKTAEAAAAYMLSQNETPEKIMEAYINLSCFQGSYGGFRGLQAASLHVFGKPICQLNAIQNFYLVATLPRSMYFKTENALIPYKSVHEGYEVEIKKTLLKKAERWFDEGLITKKEFNALKREELAFVNARYNSGIPTGTRLMLEDNFKNHPGRHDCSITLENERALASAYDLLKTKGVFRTNGSELQVAAMVVEANSGKIVGHFSSSEVLDYANCYSYPVGSVLKPAIVLEILKSGAPIDFKLFDGKVGQHRKTPRNSHGWSNVPVDATSILSKSLNGPFSNLIDLGLNPRTVYQNLENVYASMGIAKDTVSAADTYNYPLGIREMRVYEVAQIYQTIFNNGVFIPLSLEQISDTVRSRRIWDIAHVNVVKNALHQTIDDSNGTLYRYKNDLPQGKNFYGKTGTSTRQRDFWTVLSDGNLVVVCWASYGKQVGDRMVLGTEKSWGASAAGQFSVLIYNELTKTNHF